MKGMIGALMTAGVLLAVMIGCGNIAVSSNIQAESSISADVRLSSDSEYKYR